MSIRIAAALVDWRARRGRPRYGDRRAGSALGADVRDTFGSDRPQRHGRDEPSVRDADRARRPQGRRQRRRRGDRGQRLPRSRRPEATAASAAISSRSSGTRRRSSCTGSTPAAARPRSMTLAELKRRGLTADPRQRTARASASPDAWTAGSRCMAASARSRWPACSRRRSRTPRWLSDCAGHLRRFEPPPEPAPAGDAGRQLTRTCGRSTCREDRFRRRARSSAIPAWRQHWRQSRTRGRDAFYKGADRRAPSRRTSRRRAASSRSRTSPSTRPTGSSRSARSIAVTTIWELPPNTQGIAVLQMLNVLEGVRPRRHGFGSADHLHWFVEAKKLAYEDRARVVRRSRSRCGAGRSS